MKIAVNGRFLAAPAGGVQRFAREVTLRLAERVEVTLHVPRDAAVPPGLPPGTPVLRGTLPSHAWEQLELPLRFGRREEPILLHPANTGPLLGARNVMVVHDLLALSHPGWFTRRYALWCRLSQGAAARRASAVIVPSEWTGGEVQRLLGLPRERVHPVGEGTGPFSSPASEEQVRAVREKWRIPAEYLLASGVGDPRKNLEFLGEVAGRLGRRLGRAVPVLAVGGGTPWIHANGGGNLEPPAGLRPLGHVEDEELRALYTGAAAFCFPSCAEGFGRPPLEAMGCGTPAVVAPYGPAAEVLGGGARIVPLETEAWVDALVPLLRDPGERSRWSEQGRRVAREHTWDRVVDQVLRTCEGISGG